MSSPRSGGVNTPSGMAAMLGLSSRTNSLALFVSVNLFYFLVFAMGKSMISLFCYLMLAPITLGVLLKALHLTPAEEGPWEVVSRSSLQSRVDTLYVKTNQMLEFCRDVCLWKDVFYTAKVCCALLTIGYISSFFSFASLVFLTTWGWCCYSSCAALLKETVQPAVAPYIKAANQALHDLFRSIPKMEESPKKIS